jgi:hypothetical protein
MILFYREFCVLSRQYISAPIWYGNYCDRLHRFELSLEELEWLLIHSNISQHFMEIGGSLSCLPVPVMTQMNLAHKFLYLFKIHFNIILIYMYMYKISS